MQLAQQIKIKPTNEQKEVLWKLSERCRLCYNFALTERMKSWEENKDKSKEERTYIGYNKQQNDLSSIKEKYPEYKIVYSKVLQYVLKTLDADYKSFFSLWKKGDADARPPRYKGKKYFTTMVYNQSGFKCYNNKIRLSHKYDKTSLEFDIPKKFKFSKIYQISIYQKDNDFYVSVTYEKETKPYIDNGLYQSFDLGVTKQTCVNIYGKFKEFKNIRPDKYWEKQIQEVQAKRDHCKKYSRKWKFYNKSLKYMKRKSANQLKDFQHKLSRKIVDNTKSNTIIVGDLSVKDMSKKENKIEKLSKKANKSIHRSMQNTGTIGRFVKYLTYKSEIAGKKTIDICERHSSKTCCCCGKKHDMPITKRIMECDCGNNIDRDKNSSINIMLRFLSQNGLWTAYQQFVDNLRQTGIPIGLHS